MEGSFPPNWYQYEFPLPKVNGAPVPSRADYSPENCAWLIEMFAQVLGTSHTDLRLRYENNTPDNRLDDIFVEHPNDALYLTEESLCRPESPEMFKYKQKAQGSARLKKFEEFSPAGIKYFKDLGCEKFFSVSFIMPPALIVEAVDVEGWIHEEPDTLDLEKVNQPVYSHDGDDSYIVNTDGRGYITFSFQDLPFDAPELYSSITFRWIDRALTGTGNSGGVTGRIPGAVKEDSYVISTGYAYHQLTWAERDFTREEVNQAMFTYHSKDSPLPTKRLTSVELVAQAAE